MTEKYEPKVGDHIGVVDGKPVRASLFDRHHFGIRVAHPAKGGRGAPPPPR